MISIFVQYLVSPGKALQQYIVSISCNGKQASISSFSFSYLMVHHCWTTEKESKRRGRGCWPLFLIHPVTTSTQYYIEVSLRPLLKLRWWSATPLSSMEYRREYRKEPTCKREKKLCTTGEKKSNSVPSFCGWIELKRSPASEV